MPALKPIRKISERLPGSEPQHIHVSVDLAEGTRLKISATTMPASRNRALTGLTRPGHALPAHQPDANPRELLVEESAGLMGSRGTNGWKDNLRAHLLQLPNLFPKRAETRIDIALSLFIALVIFFAAVPPMLVIRDRWLVNARAITPLDGLWCQVGFLCNTQLPHYFSAVIASSLALFILVFLKRGGSLYLTRPHGHLITSTTESQVSQPPIQARLGRILFVIAAISLLIAVWMSIRMGRVQGWWFLQALICYASGWLLLEIPVGKIASAWRRSSGVLAAFILAHAALILFLQNLSQSRSLSWMYVLASGLAWANLARYYKRIPAILWVVTIALVLFTFRTNHWAYSVIGDDESFYSYALQIAEQFPASYTATHLFDGLAVHGSHPFFSSFIQAISLKFLGSSNFGWRFSSLYLSAISIGFFYLFFKQFIPVPTALISTLFLAASHYLMTFGKIGYNNLQALFVMSLVLWAAAWGIRSGQKLAFVVLGLSMGLCFYVYPSALYALPLPFLLLLFYDPPITWQSVRRWTVMVVSLVLILFPLLLQPEYWQSKIAGTILYNPNVVSSLTNIIFHFASNLLYSFYSFLYTPDETHFVVASYTDPLTAGLILIGLPVAIAQARKERFMVFFLASFGLLLFLVGATHDRLTPPTTRMFMLLPWYSALAAMGLIWLTKQFRRSGMLTFSRAGMASLLLGGVFSLNIFQAYFLSPQRSNRYQSVEMLFVRMVQQIHNSDPITVRPMTYLFITDRDWGIDGFYLLAKIYEFPASQVHLQQVTVDRPEYPQSIREVIADPNTLVILSPFMSDQWQTILAASLPEFSKQTCVIKALNGDRRFTLGYSPSYRWLCSPP